MLEIDTESSMTFLGVEEQKEDRKKHRIKQLLEERREKNN